MRSRAWLFGLAVLGCGTSSSDAQGTSSSSGGGTIGGNIKDGGLDTSDCAESAGIPYVVSAQDDLYSFEPNKGLFTKIGHLACPAPEGVTPNSMAIDRSGTAWVNYSDGSLFKVSTLDASRQATSYQPGPNFLKMGMAFSKTAKSKKETLYIVGLDSNDSKVGKGVGVIDLETMTLTMLGYFSGDLMGRAAELTGTGDGKLFGFFTTKPDASIAQINGADGSTSNITTLPSVNTGSSWAFSFWGGDFWFYTSPGGASPSTVTRLARSKDDELSVTVADVGGFRIVGAGVSTCAPIEPPK